LPELCRSGEEDLPQAVRGLDHQLLELDYKAAELIESLGLEVERAGEDTPLEVAEARERLEGCLEQARGAHAQAQTHLDDASRHALVRKVRLEDVTPLPLGIAAAGDVFTRLIDQNTTVPAEHRRVFTTNQDGQSEVEIRVYQGRSSQASDNQKLGAFILEGIAPAPRMQPRIEVSFRIDANGILTVAARDAASGVAQAMRVEDPLGLQQVEPAADEALSEALAEELDFNDATGARVIDLDRS